MMAESKYNPNVHRRKTMRLKEYDYSKAGLYFVTICVKKKEHLFGEIVDSVMIHNQAGLVTDHCWSNIPHHFPNALLHEHIVMPNHVHGIIELKESSRNSVSCTQQNRFQHLIPGSIVKGFKIGVTKWFRYGIEEVFPVGAEYILPLRETQTGVQQPSIWQRNFHDHIIRNEEEYFRISNYIINNPRNWQKDKFYLPKLNM